VGGLSSGGDLSTGWGSTKMISNSCSYANRKILIKTVGQYLLPTGPSATASAAVPLGSGSCTGSRHVDPFGHLIPGQPLVT